MSFTTGDLIALLALLVTVLALAGGGLAMIVRLQSDQKALRAEFDAFCEDRKARIAAYELRMGKAEEVATQLSALNMSVAHVADRFGREMLHLTEKFTAAQEHTTERLAEIRHEQRNQRMQLQSLGAPSPRRRRAAGEAEE